MQSAGKSSLPSEMPKVKRSFLKRGGNAFEDGCISLPEFGLLVIGSRKMPHRKRSLLRGARHSSTLSPLVSIHWTAVTSPTQVPTTQLHYNGHLLTFSVITALATLSEYRTNGRSPYFRDNGGGHRYHTPFHIGMAPPVASSSHSNAKTPGRRMADAFPVCQGR